jgi:CHAD domain-containing protein
MIPSGKWIDGIDADGFVHDAARRSLEARLTAVIHALPLAAYLADHDVEHVHRLRVSTRRAKAALDLYRDWLPRRAACWIRRRLKKIRRAAGDARDLDVLGARLADEYGDRAAPVVAIIAARRQDVQLNVVEAAERCRRGDRFVRKTDKLLSNIKTQVDEQAAAPSFYEWAVARLEDASKSFFDEAPGDSTDTAALHQFRIRGKALRYTIELVASAFPPNLRHEQYPVVEELQERLGKVQDHVTAIVQLCDWASDANNGEHQNLLRELAEEERESLIDAVNEFRSWWTDERAQTLRCGLLPSIGIDSPTEHPQVIQQT